MYGGDGHGDDPLDGHYYAAVALALELDEYALHALEVAADDAYGSAFGEVHFRGVEVVERLVVAAAGGNEVVHLALGDSDFVASLVGDVLQMGDAGLDALDGRLAGMDEEQTAHGGYQLALGHVVLHLQGMAHGDEGLYPLFLEQVAHRKFATVGDAHGIPPHRVVGALYGRNGRWRLHSSIDCCCKDSCFL